MKAQWAFVAVAVSWSLATCVVAKEKAPSSTWSRTRTASSTITKGRGNAGNSLNELPRGARSLGGIRFQIGPGLIQLGSQVLKALPASMDGIKVKQQFSKLHILHATCFGGGPNEPGDEWHINDGGTRSIPSPLRRPKHGANSDRLRRRRCDWFYIEGDKEPSKAKVVWTGDNEFATSRGCHLRIYASTWTNPKPGERVMRIDFVGRKEETRPQRYAWR